MKTLIPLILLGWARLSAHADDDALLWAISQVESGGDDAAVGPCGARGRYQISGAVWFQHAPAGWDHKDAHDPRKAEIVARKHIAWIRKHANSTCPQYIAGCWNKGVRGWRNHCDARTGFGTGTDYTWRVYNLYLSRLH